MQYGFYSLQAEISMGERHTHTTGLNPQTSDLYLLRNSETDEVDHRDWSGRTFAIFPVMSEFTGGIRDTDHQLISRMTDLVVLI